MTYLNDDCNFNVYVNPQDWQNKKADITKPWYIDYTFFDPKYSIPYPKGLTTRIKKGINLTGVQSKRKAAIELCLRQLTERLSNKGYNPIVEKLSKIPITETVTEPLLKVLKTTPFLNAFDFALDNAILAEITKVDTKSVLKQVKAGAVLLGFDSIPISELNCRYLTGILNYCLSNPANKWSISRFKKAKAYLYSLCEFLKEQGATTTNAARDVIKMV